MVLFIRFNVAILGFAVLGVLQLLNWLELSEKLFGPYIDVKFVSLSGNKTFYFAILLMSPLASIIINLKL